MSGDSGAAASSSSESGDDTCPDPGALLATLRETVDSSLYDHDLLEVIASCERLVGWVQTRQLAAVAEFARRPARILVAGEDPAAARAGDGPLGQVAREYVDEELAVRLRVSRQQAGVRVSVAAGLVRLPAARAALCSGRIDAARARVLTEELADLDGVAVGEVESGLVERAGRLSPARLREAARKVVLDADPAAARVRAQRARGGRRVWLQPLPDGMAEIGAVLPALDAVAVREAIGAAARASRSARTAGDSGGGDVRTMDQLMADAFVAPFLHALATGTLDGMEPARLARHRGQAVGVQVTVAASTLLGLDEASCELAGYGPVTAEVVREVAPDARWRRVLTDPVSGVVLDVGTAVYRPPVAIDRHVKARAQRCCFPDCGWPAVACEVDHCVPFPEGPTSEGNTRPLCARHHHVKHSPGVRVQPGPGGATRWVMPTGHVHEVEAPAVGVPIRDLSAAEDESAEWWDDTG